MSPSSSNCSSTTGLLAAEELLIPATRYYLGRCTIAAASHAQALAEQWKSLSTRVRSILRRDIEEEFSRDDAARRRGDTVLPLGHDADRQKWDLVRAAWLADDAAARGEPYNPVDDPQVPLQRIHGRGV